MDESILKNVKEIRQINGFTREAIGEVNRLLEEHWVLLDVKTTQLSEEAQKKGTYKTFIRNRSETTYILGRIV